MQKSGKNKKMPKYRIFEQCVVDVIYEVDAVSKEEAQKIWDERDCYDGLDLVGESDLESTGDFDAAYQATIAASPIAQAENRMIDVEEIAAAILYLASDEARFVTGTDIAIDGGKSLGVPPKL